MARRSAYHNRPNANGPAVDVCSVTLDCESKSLFIGLAGERSGSTVGLAVVRLPGSQGSYARVGALRPATRSKGPGLRLYESDGRTEWKTNHPYPLPKKGCRLLLVEAIRVSPHRGFEIPVEFLDRRKEPLFETKVTAKVIQAEIRFESAQVRRTGKLLCSATLPVSARGRGLNDKDYRFSWTFPRGTFDNPNSRRPTLTAATDKTATRDADLVALEVARKDDPTCKVHVTRPLNITTPDSVSLQGSPSRRQTTRLNLDNFSSASKRKGSRRLFSLRIRYTIVDQFGGDINDSYVGRNRRVVKIREQVKGNLKVFLPDNSGNDIRVNNTPRFVAPSQKGRIQDLLQAAFLKANLVRVSGGLVRFSIEMVGADYLTLRPHSWFVAIGDSAGDSVVNPDRVTDNNLRCFVESAPLPGRQLNIRTDYSIVTL